jgi:molecular chaperone DnaK (HSP70)
MDKTISVKEENLIISKFRELSEDRKQKLLNYVETLYHEEKFADEVKEFPEDFLSEQDRESLKNIADEFNEFINKEPTSEGKKALQELFSGIFECDKEIAEKHDIYLYGVNTTK